MAKSLVIVESPAKAKTISRFLGKDFDVRASVGHVADLPSRGMAVDVDNGFKPTYELTERGKQVVKDLRLALKSASELYQEVTPIVVNGIMYMPAGDRVVALEPETGV